ncbi:MAG: glycoside hydrolase family 10 protein [Fermentimonas sp.]|jgi:uncharacterized lipoprotein YddW (UPF0748 family)
MNKKIFLLTILSFFILDVCLALPPATEIRAVWLTTNYGLDWPRNRVSEDAQKRELITILDNLQKHNFNTVLFQVRARGEVFYKSKIEPMSSIVVSKGFGEKSFDPLEFVINESHKRGMQCHAWIVTYPLGLDKHVRRMGKKSIVAKDPSIVKKYKSEWYLDPGNPRTDDYLLSIVKEIVNNYDVDGIHFDYIRYPSNSGYFPDDAMYRRHGNGKNRADWRRDNITRFVSKAYSEIKKYKPWVQVSSAPLGRYKSLNDRGRGWTAYETVYQDAGKWMKMGIHDALYPMMYYKNELFYPYVDNWKENCNGRILVPGLGAYQMIELNWSNNDITSQIDYSRNGSSNGQAYFRAENVLSNTKGILNSIEKYYKYPAKLPPMTWLSDTIPNRPFDLTAEKNGLGEIVLEWSSDSTNKRVTYNIYRSLTDSVDVNDATTIMAVNIKQPNYKFTFDNNDSLYYYYITVSDSFNNESEVSIPALFYHSDTIK